MCLLVKINKYHVKVLRTLTDIKRFPEIHAEVSCLQHSVEESGLIVKLIKITGHSGIPGNEYVDCKAKSLGKNISSGKTDAPSVMTISDARKVSTDIAMKSNLGSTNGMKTVKEDVLTN